MPHGIAVNPFTNKIYVANNDGGNVTVIDGNTNAITTVDVGARPETIAVNTVTNRIYVVNDGSASVTVIDGATNATTDVLVPPAPYAVAVNSVTNKIYVTSPGFSIVTVIDGATNETTLVNDPNAKSSYAVAVNQVTNKVYVANNGSNNVTVIDGATNATTTVAAEVEPIAIVVNPVTNKIYVANGGSATVTAIDGATNTTTSVPTGIVPVAMAVNPLTNTIFVANYSDNDVTVIDGATDTTTTVLAGLSPDAIAVDSVTNKVYVANSVNPSVTVFDGATTSSVTIRAGLNPFAIAVNSITNTIFVANSASDNVTVIAGALVTQPATSARLINISTRAQVGIGGNILIPGFVIDGSGTERLLIRGGGPSLIGFGVTGAIVKPSLSVFDSSGTLVASNTGWGTNSKSVQIANLSSQVGAYPYPSGSADCAVVVDLPAGAYTVQVSGVNGTTGIALAEVYEVASTGTRLVNISTRAQVGTGGDMIIAGFVISGSGSEELLVRAGGPSLTQFGVTGALAEPSLSVVNNAGEIASNTGWTSADPSLIAGFEEAVGAFSFTPGSGDCAQIVNLPAGGYTMQISGANNTVGVGLAEVYEIP